MEVLQTILVEQLGQIPRLLAKEFFADKLRDAGVPYTDNLLEKLTDHCISGNQEVFRWDDDGDESADVELTISNADLAAFDRRASKFFEQLPDIIEGVATKSAATIVRNLRKNWAGEHKLQKIEISEFRLHLEKYWDEPLNLLRMIVTIAREIVSEQAVRKRRSKRYKALPDALLRLNVRACQITSEVITLLENGFADGAMARWRTLYEVSVVAMVIAEGGETLAKRYVDHQYVEAKGGLERYLRCYKRLGYQPVSKQSIETINKEYASIIDKYGKRFGSQYGWASEVTSKQRPTFADLEIVADIWWMRSHYHLASHNIHAGPHALYFRLGDASEGSMLLLGPSDAGLTEPGQNTAVALVKTVSALLGEPYSLDKIVTMHILLRLRDATVKAFAKADKELTRAVRTLKQLKTV